MTEGTPSTPVSALKANTANTPVAANSPLRSKDVLLPLARVRTIMKSSPDVENIGQESLFLITKVSLVKEVHQFILITLILSTRSPNHAENRTLKKGSRLQFDSSQL